GDRVERRRLEALELAGTSVAHRSIGAELHDRGRRRVDLEADERGRRRDALDPWPLRDGRFRRPREGDHGGDQKGRKEPIREAHFGPEEIHELAPYRRELTRKPRGTRVFRGCRHIHPLPRVLRADLFRSSVRKWGWKGC